MADSDFVWDTPSPTPTQKPKQQAKSNFVWEKPVSKAESKPKPSATPESRFVWSTPSPVPFQTNDLVEPVVPGHVLDLSGQVGLIGEGLGDTFQGVNSAINNTMGVGDLPFVMLNGMMRDEVERHADYRGVDVFRLAADPTSNTHRAWELYRKNPVAAMNEYGEGAQPQNDWMKSHEIDPGLYGERLEAWLADKPIQNAIQNFFVEGFNPALLGMGVVGSGAADLGRFAFSAARAGKMGTKAAKVAEMMTKAGRGTAYAAGLGSPLYNISDRGGRDSVNWVNSLINSQMAPEKFLKTVDTDTWIQQVFGGLSPDAANEVGRIYQGLKPNPVFMKQYGDLKRRANLLKKEIDWITSGKIKRDLLEPKNVWKSGYLPMKNSYDYPFNPTFGAELRDEGTAGMGLTEHKPKTFSNLDQSAASGKLKTDFYLPNNLSVWRDAQLKRMAWEDRLKAAPKEMHLPTSKKNKGIRAKLILNQGKLNVGGKMLDYRYADAAEALKQIKSPQLRRGVWAPEFIKFVATKYPKYLSKGTMVAGPEAGGLRKFLDIERNMIVTNPLGFHPGINISGQEASIRTLLGLKGPRLEAGGYLANAARAYAQQFHIVDPKRFVGTAEEYAHWLDKGLVRGMTGEFHSSAKYSTLGGERARVLATPAKWYSKQTVDRLLTKLGNWNRTQAFGTPGEESFAVSIFKDATESFVKSGFSQDEAESRAAEIVRQALHDYNNFDPNSPLASMDFFMPWRKGNWKHWGNMFVRKPQSVIAPTHAIRDYNQSVDPDSLNSPYAQSSFRLNIGPAGIPLTVPFVGRDVDYWANAAQAAGSALAGRQGGAGVTDVLNPLVRLGTATMNPLAKGLLQGYATSQASYQPGVQGPENNWNLLVNPKAPDRVQWQQLWRGLAGDMTLPMASFVIQDAFKRGWKPTTAVSALLMASNLGYPGTKPLTPSQRLQISRANKRLEKARYQYLYGGGDESDFKNAWSNYAQTYQDVEGVTP